MATDPFQVYPAVAQIAAVFAGFGSLASGIGQRRGADDARVDAYRLGLMLFASLSATLLGLLPAALAGLLGPTPALRVSALAAVVALVVYAPLGARRARAIQHVTGFNMPAAVANIACAAAALAAFGLCASGIPADRLADVYLLGLMGLLGSSVVMFSRVIASMLRPHERG